MIIPFRTPQANIALRSMGILLRQCPQSAGTLSDASSTSTYRALGRITVSPCAPLCTDAANLQE